MSIADDAVIENSTVGPHVSVGQGASIRGSSVKEAILAESAVVEESTIERSILGKRAQAVRAHGQLIIGDDAKVSG